mgnify:CR=1 FL=1
MTTPVDQAMSWDAERKRWRMQAMRFVYESPEQGTAGADPADAGVTVIDVPASDWLAVTLRGSRSGKAVTRATDKLLATVDAEAVRMMSYNSPFVPGPFQIWEIQLPVQQGF